MSVRPATPDDMPFMWEMLYEAVYWPPERDEAKPTRREIFAIPEIARYLEGWGRSEDKGSVAFDADGRVGAAWYRRTTPDKPGYGFAEEGTPEVVIAVAPEHRARGIGGDLLQALIATARSSGCPALSLSVDKTNPAARLYKRCGFSTVKTRDTDFLMKLNLTQTI